MIRSTLAFFADEPPVLVDWPPWNHTFGGNHDFGLVLYNGGSFYIDEGKPLPGAIEATVRNLREIAPTILLQRAQGLRGAAALSARRRGSCAALSSAGSRCCSTPARRWRSTSGTSCRSWRSPTCGERIMFLTGLGSTETAPFALARTWESEHAGNIGVPMPGVELKLVPMRRQARGAAARGPNITPGYWRAAATSPPTPSTTKGFYKLGDALRFEDPDDPGEGLLFDGRIAEDFKLATGTWVSVGPLRARFIAHCAPLVRDVVIAGADRDDIARADLSRPRGLPRLAGLTADAPSPPVLADARELRARVQSALTHSRGRAPAARTASAAPSCWTSRPRSTPAK